MKRVLLAVALVGCATGSGHQSGDGDVGRDGSIDDGGMGEDGGTNDGGANDGGANDGAAGDGSVSDGGATDGNTGGAITPVPLEPCVNVLSTYGPLPTGVRFPQAMEPGPLMTHDVRAFLFLESSTQWTTASAGSATTTTRPAPLAAGTYFGAFASLSGISVITYMRANAPRAVTFDGTTLGAEVALPCTNLGTYECTARAAGDGHIWVRTATTFFEQVGNTFDNRGGGPAGAMHWDVDAPGTLTMLSGGDIAAGEKLAIWRLVVGAGGWTKVGALHTSDLAIVAPMIEGGFQLSGVGPGTIAPDGSFHVFSDPRCIGTGDHNKTQVYARSRDGVTWAVEALPAADTLHAGNVTWKHGAFWASDYDNVRYVVTSSPKPVFDGYAWSYPNRRYDVIGRCLDATNAPTFGRLASTRLQGWTTRGYAAFGQTGMASLLTDEGLVQTD